MGLLFGVVVILPVALLALVVVLAVARREPDPTGRGIYAAYVFLVTFIVLFASSAAVTAIVKLIQGPTNPSPFDGVGGMMGGFGPGGPAAALGFGGRSASWRSLLEALSVAIAAGGVLWFHARRGRELLAEPGPRSDATARAYRYYLHATLLVAVIALLFGAANAIDALVRVIAPGVTAVGGSAAERRDAIEQLVGSVFLALASWGIFMYHWRRREEDARTLAPAGPPPATSPASPPPGPGEPPRQS